MLHKRAYTHRNVGSHYLNANFGWLPFVSDIQRMVKLAGEIETRLQTIQKMNGKWHTRGGTLVATSDRENHTEVAENCFYPAGIWLNTATARYEHYSEYKQKVWFKGRFCYYIPKKEFSRPEWRLNTIRKMYGITLTPDVVWNLTPWSWLIDYFSNVGDILENITGGYIDGVVSKYAYVMGTTQHRNVQNSSITLADGTKVKVQTVKGNVIKRRVSGDPFSFQMTGDLSPRQLGILVALGISRG
jgi:hypothetical protein